MIHFLKWGLLGISWLIVGCQSKKPLTEVEQANKAGILLVGIGPDPEGFDPQWVTGVTEQNVLRSLFEGLVIPDPKTLEPKPGVAERWEIQGNRYVFHLRRNARWNNEEPLTAHDFVFTFQRLLTPQLAAPNASTFFAIKNAKAFYNNEIDFQEVGVKALDNDTLEIVLEQPVPFFLSLLMQPCCYPVHQKSLEQHACAWTRNSNGYPTHHLVSNGAFQLKKWSIGEKIEMVKNTYYWNNTNVRLNGIHFFPIADVATEERAFRRGQLHITENVPYQKLNAYHTQKNSPLQIHPYLNTFYYLLNINVYPLNDVRVRKALSLAIDRNQLAGSDHLKLKHRSAYQLVPEGCAGFPSTRPIQENAVMARELLKEAGFPNGQGFPKLTLLFNANEGQTYIASAVQEMWRKHLNITIELVNQEWKVYLQRRRDGQFEIARGGWVGDYNDPTTFLNLWLKDANNNFVRWHNEMFDSLLFRANNTRHHAERLQLLQEAEKILLEDVPLILIHSSTTSHLVHSTVHNWFGNLLDWHPYDCIFLQ
ncbi:MAG: peptide ABC transporter substrate-binding protein [Puniceicoccales bacterium]|jgi:oligopeptide transport system substrate-binding protein|nr:peptide ABC transporter substrate-binding protein [Puniceicoccales bacterium]